MSRWPDTLPQQFLQQGFQDEEPDLVLQTQMAAPVPNQRRRFTAALRPFGGKLLLNASQKSIFRTFYREQGPLRFVFPDPDTGADLTVIFLGKPVYEPAGGLFQYVSIKLGEVPA